MLILVMRPSTQYLNAPEVQRIQRMGVLRVGVRTNVPGFAENGAGYEIEIARATARRIFPDVDTDVSLELVPVTQSSALAKLVSGAIDLTFSRQWNTDNEAYMYSGSYFKEGIYLLCRPGYESVALADQEIGFIDGSAELRALNIYNTDYKTALTSRTYASYPDMALALKKNEVPYIAVPGRQAQTLLDWDITVADTRLGAVDYVAVSLAEYSALALLADLVIQEMQNEGKLDQWAIQYGISAYKVS
ncbi:MAG: transporter substrate-binding domain-containing protein [Clostridiales bacterium]|nr:transporter substrate-binding domain-containing protein [Clostridiales bacterium]